MAVDPKKTTDDLGDSFKDLRDTLKSITDELSRNVNRIQEAKGEYNSLLNIAKQLQNNEEEIVRLSDKEIKNLRSKSEANLRDLKLTAERLAQEKSIVDITHTNLKFRKDLTEQELTLLSALKENFKVETQMVNQLQEEDNLRDKINKKTGVTGVLLKGMSKIPIVGELLKTDEALDAAQKKARETGSAFSSLGAAFGNMGKNLASSLADPLVSIGLLVKGFKMFLDLGFKADTEITNMSKSMAVSQQEAAATRDRFIEIQNSSDSLFETTTNLVNAQLELADAMGATRGFTENQLKDQVLLTKQMGFQAEEAAGIQQLSLANGMSAESITGSVIKQTAALAKQTGIQLDNKKVIGEVAKVSGQLRLQYANNPSLIAKAVIQTKKLGLSLEQAAKAANSLLDFESSIENELSAELLTGKSLNLERARGLALNGDAAGAAAEMAKQIGTAADFTSMNVIQQEALAKSVGMTADELADSLVAQENLTKLGSQTRQQVEEQIALAKKQGDMDKVRMLENSIGNEEDAKAALEKISAQEKFNAAIEKLKAMLASIVEGPAATFVNMLGKMLSNSTALKTILAIIAGTVTAMAVAFAVMNPIAAGIGLAMAGGIYAATSMKDGVINPKGGLVVSGEKGSIQLDKEDSIIAGTNLGGKGKSSSGGGSMNSSAVVNAIVELRRDINALASRPVNVSIDGKKVIEATTGNQPNTVGDESRKNSYQIA
jgi:hypothetical protein